MQNCFQSAYTFPEPKRCSTMMFTTYEKYLLNFSLTVRFLRHKIRGAEISLSTTLQCRQFRVNWLKPKLVLQPVENVNMCTGCPVFCLLKKLSNNLFKMYIQFRKYFILPWLITAWLMNYGGTFPACLVKNFENVPKNSCHQSFTVEVDNYSLGKF